MKYITILLFLFIASCVSNKYPSVRLEISLKDEINKSIFDGFYNNDSTKISKEIYFIK